MSDILRIRLSGVALPFDASDEELPARAASVLGAPESAFRSFRIERRALDARRNRPLAHVHTLRIDVDPGHDHLRDHPHVTVVDADEEASPWPSPAVVASSGPRPVVVGAGPAGLFAALTLCRAGRPPVVLERGRPVEERSRRLAAFWRAGDLDPECNSCFGEGGAGAFSDGKLTCRTKDRRRERAVREQFVAWGAPPAAACDAEAHVGTDRLRRVLRAAREELLSLGAEIRFGAALTGLRVEDGRLRGVETADGVLETDCCIAAVGQHAEDTVRMLRDAGVRMVPQGYAVGVRVEHPQRIIDRARFGPNAGRPGLGPASYRLARKGAPGLRPCHTFCMCPGGLVVACAVEDGRVFTNGMSASSRSGDSGNAAFVVPVGPDDFPETDPPELAGFAFRRGLEHAAFAAGGGGFALPVSSLRSFLAGEYGDPPRRVLERGFPRVVTANVSALLPEDVSRSLRAGVSALGRKLPGFLGAKAAVFGVESRTSSPVRMVCDDRGMSVSVAGLYPCGEGAGRAGGIVGAAIDGMTAAAAALH